MTIIGAAEREIARGISNRIIDRAIAEQEHAAIKRRTERIQQDTNNLGKMLVIKELQEERDAWKQASEKLKENSKAWKEYAEYAVNNEKLKRIALQEQFRTAINAIKTLVQESQKQFIDEVRSCPNTEHHRLVLGRTDEQIFEENNAKIDELIRQIEFESPSSD